MKIDNANKNNRTEKRGSKTGSAGKAAPGQNEGSSRLGSLIFLGALLLLLVGFYVAAQPFLALHEIRQAAIHSDQEQMAANINEPVLKENLTEQFLANMSQALTADAGTGEFGIYVTEMAIAVVTSLVDAAVTPEGLLNLISYRQAPEEQQDALAFLRDASYSWNSLSEISVTIYEEDLVRRTHFILQRDGLDWQLVNIIVPDADPVDSRMVKTAGSAR